MNLKGKDRPTNPFVKKLLCCHEDENKTFRLDLSCCQAVLIIKIIYNRDHVMLYEFKLKCIFNLLTRYCTDRPPSCNIYAVQQDTQSVAMSEFIQHLC